MLDLVARLLVALSVAAGAAGLATAQDHASPGGSPNAVAAIEAIIARLSDAAAETLSPTSQQPATSGLDRATDVANDHAATGLERAKAGSDNAGAAAGQAPVVDTPPVAAPPVETPPVDVPAANGPPATHPPHAAPPVPVPPVPAPPVDAPGQGNRP